jgi:hypothetical protein
VQARRLAALETATQAGTTTTCRAAADARVEHRLAQFGQEERWMAYLGLEPENAHKMHRHVAL